MDRREFLKKTTIVTAGLTIPLTHFALGPTFAPAAATLSHWPHIPIVDLKGETDIHFYLHASKIDPTIYDPEDEWSAMSFTVSKLDLKEPMWRFTSPFHHVLRIPQEEIDYSRYEGLKDENAKMLVIERQANMVAKETRRGKANKIFYGGELPLAEMHDETGIFMGRYRTARISSLKKDEFVLMYIGSPGIADKHFDSPIWGFTNIKGIDHAEPLYYTQPLFTKYVRRFKLV